MYVTQKAVKMLHNLTLLTLQMKFRIQYLWINWQKCNILAKKDTWRIEIIHEWASLCHKWLIVISLIDTSVYLFAGWFNQFPAIFAPFPQGYRKGLTQNWKKLKFLAWRLEISNFFFNFSWALFYTLVETAQKWLETG